MRPIDADLVKKTLNDLECVGGHKYWREGVNTMINKVFPQIIDDMPTVEINENQTKTGVLNMNELTYNTIMGVIYGAMWDYNFNVRLNNSTDELLSSRRGYINGLSTMAAAIGIKVIVTYENIFTNSLITDITVNGTSVLDWKNGIDK